MFADVGRPADLPLFGSGVTVDQVLTHYQRVDGCRSVSVVATGCRHRCRQVIRWQADLDPGRGPSPYHGEAWRSLKVVDPGQMVSMDRKSSAGAGLVAALFAAHAIPRPRPTWA